MQRYTGYFFVSLIVWMPRMAEAQRAREYYEPQPGTPFSALIYLVVIGVVG